MKQQCIMLFLILLKTQYLLGLEGRHHAPHVEPVLRQRASLVEAEGVDGTAEVDGARTDTEDLVHLETVLGEDDTHGHGCGQCGRDDNSDEVQRTQYDLLNTASSPNLKKKTENNSQRTLKPD